MATATGKIRCVICNKEKATFKCAGCLEDYCYNHLEDHRQGLNKQLDNIEVERDIFRELVNEQIEKSKNHTLIQEIDKWEQDSIKLIQQAAQKAREILFKNINEYIPEIEIKLNKLTNHLRETRQENEFNEINLRQFQEKLDELKKELIKLSHISFRQVATSLINKISVNVPGSSTLKSNIHHNKKWIQNGFTGAGGNGTGNELNQLYSPVSIYVDDDQTVYVADYHNHRIVKWNYGATNGLVVGGGNGPGNEMNQLNHPTDVIVDKERNHLIICDKGNKRIVRLPRRNGTSGQTIISNIDCCRLAMDNNGDLYVSNWKKHEVRRWKMDGTDATLVAGGNGKGHGLNQFHNPTYIFVDADHSVYVSDCRNNRVMKWMEGGKEGIVVAGGQGQGNGLKQFSCPRGLIVDQLGTLYVAMTLIITE